MESKNSIKIKAKNILSIEKEEIEHIKLCLRAGICPKCGSKLEVKRKKLFPFIYRDTVVCPENHILFFDFIGDMSSPYNNVYSDCTNGKIWKFRFYHYEPDDVG